MSKCTLLKQLITQRELNFILEAHNGLSAKIVENAGFEGIWASGLSISASLGLRDSNEASWTQVLEVCEFMADRTSIPILVDGDTGFGNFNNLRRLVKKLEQRGIAGVCIEDKRFPKTNSFLNNTVDSLAKIDEMCGKIKAAKDTQLDPDFVLVARTESFIAGCKLKETVKRAEAYRLAGADAILVHSKATDPHEIDLFMQEWANRHPIIIVPTTYASTPTQHFRNLGINLVIWANHNLRAAVKAMTQLSQKIHDQESLEGLDDMICNLSDIFTLQDTKELSAAEKKYLPKLEEPAPQLSVVKSGVDK